MADMVLTVGPAPHVRSGANMVRNHYAMILALMPGILAAYLSYGAQALAIFTLALVTWVLMEGLAQWLFHQPIYALDGHGILMAFLFALLLPQTVPWWLVVVGVTFAAVVGKQLYGGIGGFPFHPAMVGYLIVLVSWPHHVNPVGDALLVGGCPYAIALGGVILWGFGFINRIVPIAFFVGLLTASAIFSAVYPEQIPNMWAPLQSGSIILAAFFLLCDETTSPANRLAKVLFGLLAGALVMLIRVYGVWMEVVPFAVMLVNLVNPLLDRIKPKPVKTS